MQVTADIYIDEKHLSEEFIRSSGPGGQNVNKVETAVQLRCDVASSGLPESMKGRLKKLAGRMMTDRGVLVITARRFRTREQNRNDARDRLASLLRSAAQRPKKRRKTAPTYSSRKLRLETKRQRSNTKKLRRYDPAGEN